MRGFILTWFTSYLSNRKQFTSFVGNNSEFCNILCGVPQGPILQGPDNFPFFYRHLWNVWLYVKLFTLILIFPGVITLIIFLGRVSKGVGSLSNPKHIHPWKILRTIYQTSILPHLLIYCLVWNQPMSHENNWSHFRRKLSAVLHTLNHVITQNCLI